MVVVKSNHDEDKQIIRAFRQEVSTMVETVTNSFGQFASLETPCEPPTKRQVNQADLQLKSWAVQEYIKFMFVAQMLDSMDGKNIFRRNHDGASFSCITLHSVGRILVDYSHGDQTYFLNKNTDIGKIDNAYSQIRVPSRRSFVRCHSH